MADTTILIQNPDVVRDIQLAEILVRIDALPRQGEPLTDDDLYDEDGLPRGRGDFSKTDIVRA